MKKLIFIVKLSFCYPNVYKQINNQFYRIKFIFHYYSKGYNLLRCIYNYGKLR